MKLNADMIVIDKFGYDGRDGTWHMNVNVPEKMVCVEGGCSPQLRIRHDFSPTPDEFRMYVYHNHGDETILVSEEEFNEWRTMSIGRVCEQKCIGDFDMSLESEDETPLGETCVGCTNEEVKKEADAFDRTHMTYKNARILFGINFEEMQKQLVERWKALQLIVSFGISR